MLDISCLSPMRLLVLQIGGKVHNFYGFFSARNGCIGVKALWRERLSFLIRHVGDSLASYRVNISYCFKKATTKLN